MFSREDQLRQHLSTDPGAEALRQYYRATTSLEPLGDDQRRYLEQRSRLVPWVVVAYLVALAVGAVWAFASAVDALGGALATGVLALVLGLPAALVLRYCLALRADLRDGRLVHVRGPLSVVRESGPNLSHSMRIVLPSGSKLRRAGWGLTEAVDDGRSLPPRGLLVYGEHARKVMLLQEESGLTRFDATVGYLAGRARWRAAAAQAGQRGAGHR